MSSVCPSAPASQALVSVCPGSASETCLLHTSAAHAACGKFQQTSWPTVDVWSCGVLGSATRRQLPNSSALCPPEGCGLRIESPMNSNPRQFERSTGGLCEMYRLNCHKRTGGWLTVDPKVCFASKTLCWDFNESINFLFTIKHLWFITPVILLISLVVNAWLIFDIGLHEQQSELLSQSTSSYFQFPLVEIKVHVKEYNFASIVKLRLF